MLQGLIAVLVLGQFVGDYFCVGGAERVQEILFMNRFHACWWHGPDRVAMAKKHNFVASIYRFSNSWLRLSDNLLKLLSQLLAAIVEIPVWLKS